MWVPESEPHLLKSVFALTNPNDMLHKLAWEIRELEASLRTDADEFPWTLAPAYRAYNCAVTAVHLADWLWQSCTPDQHAQVAAQFGFTLTQDSRKNLTRFYDAVAKKCRAFHICREIANGSKHMKPNKSDDDVLVHADWRIVESEGRHRYVFTLHIDDNGRRVTAISVFIAARDFWENLLGELFFIEGRRYVQGKPLGV